jgi:hypothetical protein
VTWLLASLPQVPRESLVIAASSSADDATRPRNCNDGLVAGSELCQTADWTRDQSPWLSAYYPCDISLGSVAFWCAAVASLVGPGWDGLQPGLQPFARPGQPRPAQRCGGSCLSLMVHCRAYAQLIRH